MLVGLTLGLVACALWLRRRGNIDGALADAAMIERVEGVLPQTQCRQCGYAGCAPYAAAIVRRHESIALCPPGGAVTRHALSAMLGRDVDGGAAAALPEPRRVALVREADCIGCTKCIQACPVDAIVGAAGLMHTVVAAWCTGCDLCAPVCPTDCIEMPFGVAVPGARARG